MKKTLSLLTLSLVAAIAYSQHEHKFGYISKEESDLKTCAFDPEASAVVLLKEAYSEYGEDNELLTYYHVRIKILKQDGDQFGDISIPYRSENGFENVDNVDAVTIKLDDNGNRKDIAINPASIYNRKINKYSSQVSFAFPDVNPGAILEYKYRIIAKHYGGIRDWYFQSEIPVLNSSYRLKIVPGHEVSYLVQYNPNYKVGVRQIGSDNAIRFEMNNIPALYDEPYMDAKEDYIQKVIFQTTKFQDGQGGADNFMSTWKEVIRELNDRNDFGRQTRIKIDECLDFVNTSLVGKSEIEKMQMIHHYVSGNVTWDGYYGIVTEDGIKNLWKKKAGNSAEINLLLVNLLRSAGLDAYPMLVSERGHGKVNKDQPFISQFNNVYAAVFIGGKKYFLDATDKYTPSTITPYSILNTTAFIVDHKAGGLLDINENAIRYEDNITIVAKLDGSGELSGSVRVESKDYARSEKLRNYINHKSEYVESYVKTGMTNIDVANFNIKNVEEETLPITQQFDFKTSVQSNDDYAFISYNIFTGLQSNPFILNDRFSNVNFGFKKSVNLTYVINIPENYKVDALPKNIKLVNSDNSVTMIRQFFHSNNQIMAKVNVSIDKSLFPVSQYSGVKDFFKQMVNMMNEQIVLRKK